MMRTHVRSALAAAAAAAVTTAGLASAPTAAATATSPTAVTFGYDADTPTQSFTVPAGVTSVTVSASGGAGAPSSFRDTGDTPGGSGGTASGTFTVTPGSVLSVLVAADGSSNPSCATTDWGQIPCGGTGYGKGGDGFDAGGGGGASAVVTTGGAALVVAGGGGAAGAAAACMIDDWYTSVAGGTGGSAGQSGSAGNTAAQPGSASSTCPSATPAGGGGAGTDDAPGAGGITEFRWNDDYCSYPFDGRAGSGHDGGGFTYPAAFRGGGGGAGWYGGGQGGDACEGGSGGGGGGGANHVDASATSPATGTSTRGFGQNGIVIISYLVSDPTPPSDTTPPSITFNSDGFTAGSHSAWGAPLTAPTCAATDTGSGVNSNGCVVTGLSTAVGTHQLTATATDRTGNIGTATLNYSVDPWSTSVFQPVDLGGVFNTVKGGSTVPVKFAVKAGTASVTDPAKVGSFSATKVSCSTGAPTDEIETTTTGATSLRYDATTRQFVYNWQTPKVPGACYQLTLTTQDGTKTPALFRLK